MIWIISILGLLLIVSVFAIYNLLTKVEKYEDVIQDQVKYLNNNRRLHSPLQYFLRSRL